MNPMMIFNVNRKREIYTKEKEEDENSNINICLLEINLTNFYFIFTMFVVDSYILLLFVEEKIPMMDHLCICL